MITINLLPETYRTPQTASVLQLYRSPLLIVLAALLAGAVLLLQVMGHVRRRQLSGLQAQIDARQPQKRDVDAVKAAVQKLREQHGAFTSLTTQRSHWAQYLGLLPDVTPDGIWLRELSFDTQKGLVLQGAALGQGGDEMLRIGRMAQALKTDPTFSMLVRDIQIESMKRVQDGEIEVIQFTLSGSVTPPAAQETPS